MSTNLSLSWPSHIRNSFDLLKKNKKNIDLLILVIDSRSETASSFLDLKKIFINKKILIIYSKKDISDGCQQENIFNLKKHENRRKIMNLITNCFNDEKKLTCKEIYIVGIPNSGKSTLINLLKNKKQTKSENSPGTTKQIAKFYLGKNIWLYDSPGILLPKLQNKENIKKLFLINSLPVNDELHYLFLESAFYYLKKYYFQKIANIIINKKTETKINIENLNYPNFLIEISKKFNFKKKNNEIFIEMGEKKFLNLIHSSAIGKINWDKEWNF